MKTAWTGLMFVMIALAGCADDDPADELPMIDDTPPPPAVDLKLLDLTHELHVTAPSPSPVGGTFPAAAGQDNCARLEGVQQIRNGTLTATWDPTPATATMQVRVEGNDTWAAEGAPGMTIALDGLTPGNAGTFTFYALPAAPGVAVVQTVTIHWAGTYIGEGAPTVTGGLLCLRTT